MLTRAAAAKVLASDHQDFGSIVGFAVEDEVRFRTRGWILAQGVKESILQAGSLQRLQELLGNDHIRVDVLDVERSRQSLYDDELFDAGGCF